jgi:PAS domain S-box-containing protein
MGVVFLSTMPLAAAAYQQKKVEENLRKERELYKTLIDTSPDAILVSDLKGIIRVVNKRTIEMYGLKKRNDIVGRSGFDFVAFEDIEKTQKALSEVLTKGKIENFEYTSVKKNGKKFSTSGNASIFYNSEGSPEGIIIVSHDISKQKEAEKIQSEFVSLASHQLRTPLGSMRWSIEMLDRGDFGPISRTIKTVIRDIYDSLIRLINLVNDLLDVSRVEEGRIVERPQKVDVVNLLNKIVTHLSPLARKKGIKIQLKALENHKTLIFIDKGKLTDVFENLLSNAFKYTKPNGKVNIYLKYGKNYIRVDFKDTGIGIPQEDKGKVFTKFYRSRASVEMENEGTGLGLFLVKSYLEEWGGKVTFKSNLGKGSIFTIFIPKSPKKLGEKKINHYE